MEMEQEELLRARVAALEAETGRQGEEIARLLKKIRDLEEENDLLALDNERLREQEEAAKGTTGGEHQMPQQQQQDSAGGNALLWDTPMARLATASPVEGNDKGIGICGLPPDDSYLEEGDGRFATREAFVIEGVGSGLNPLCCRVAPLLPEDDEGGGESLLIATGGVDRFLTLYTLSPHAAGAVPEKAATLGGFPGPLLSLDLAPAVVEVEVAASSLGGEEEGEDSLPKRRRRVRPALVTCMDGSHAHVHLSVDDLGGSSIAGVHKGHEKHAVVGRFSPCGSMFATGGHDKAVRVYDAGTGHELKAFFFAGNVEALAWVEADEKGGGGSGADSPSKGKTPYLVIASRNVAHLTYVDSRTWEKRGVSLNQAEWDDHVSFAVLALSASPCGQFLLAATDKSRLIVYRMGSNVQLRNLYGHRADEYSNPRAVWDKSGKYVFCSSQDGHELVGWSIASERVVARLKGHTGIVRDVAYDPAADALVSVGYDKALRVWLP